MLPRFLHTKKAVSIWNCQMLTAFLYLPHTAESYLLRRSL